MQPDDKRTDFQQPAQVNYYVAPPAEDSSEEVVSEDEAPVVATQAQSDTIDVVQWQSVEYIQQQKSPIWFGAFGCVVVALIAVALFLIKSPTFAVLIPVMAVALLAYSYRPPRTIDYTLSNKGLYISDTLHSFTEFRAFGVTRDEAQPAIVFIPVRRFRPSLTVYFPEEKGESIVDLLGVRIPMQTIKPDAFDKIVRSLGL